MIKKVVRLYIIIQGNKLIYKIVPSVQNNQIKNHEIKDTVVINQISIIVSYTINEKVYPSSIYLLQYIYKTFHTNILLIL